LVKATLHPRLTVLSKKIDIYLILEGIRIYEEQDPFIETETE